MRTITLTEKLAKELGYKDLKGLKMAISRKYSKNGYSEDLKVEVSKLISAVSKKINDEMLIKLLNCFDRSNSEDVGEDELSITFNVKKELESNIKSSIKASAFMKAFSRQNISDKKIIEEAIKGNKQKFAKTQELLEKRVKEYKEIQQKLDTLNLILQENNSNFRFKQFISIDKSMYSYTNIYLTGNGYFKKIFEDDLSCLVIKNQYNMKYFDWHDTVEEKLKEIDSLKENNLYIFDVYNGNHVELDLTQNFDDGVDYGKDYKEICYQAFSKYEIKTSVSVHDYIDFRTEDGKIEFELCDDDCINTLLSNFNQEPYYHWDHKYSFSLEKLEGLLNQLKDKDFETYVENIKVKIS